MCDWGDTTMVRVRIPKDASYTDAARWDHKPVDRCIAPIVSALNSDGLYTRGCCCGHGKSHGSIVLWDGRILRIDKHKYPSLLERLERWYRNVFCTRGEK